MMCLHVVSGWVYAIPCKSKCTREWIKVVNSSELTLSGSHISAFWQRGREGTSDCGPKHHQSLQAPHAPVKHMNAQLLSVVAHAGGESSNCRCDAIWYFTNSLMVFLGFLES